jgi:hypothetical protein
MRFMPTPSASANSSTAMPGRAATISAASSSRGPSRRGGYSRSARRRMPDSAEAGRLPGRLAGGLNPLHADLLLQYYGLNHALDVANELPHLKCRGVREIHPHDVGLRTVPEAALHRRKRRELHVELVGRDAKVTGHLAKSFAQAVVTGDKAIGVEPIHLGVVAWGGLGEHAVCPVRRADERRRHNPATERVVTARPTPFGGVIELSRRALGRQPPPNLPLSPSRRKTWAGDSED